MTRDHSAGNQRRFVMKFGEQIHAVTFDKQPAKCSPSLWEMLLLVPCRLQRFPVRYQRPMEEALCVPFHHLSFLQLWNEGTQLAQAHAMIRPK